ncbi:hypothetical protein GW17_00050051 [Ensete ventricosum]|nr:hypothetical protein GW17_00050051 [Ensete ventricosum]
MKSPTKNRRQGRGNDGRGGRGDRKRLRRVWLQWRRVQLWQRWLRLRHDCGRGKKRKVAAESVATGKGNSAAGDNRGRAVGTSSRDDGDSVGYKRLMGWEVARRREEVAGNRGIEDSNGKAAVRGWGGRSSVGLIVGSEGSRVRKQRRSSDRGGSNWWLYGATATIEEVVAQLGSSGEEDGGWGYNNGAEEFREEARDDSDRGRIVVEDLHWCSLLARDADSKEGRDSRGGEEWQMVISGGEEEWQTTARDSGVIAGGEMLATEATPMVAVVVAWGYDGCEKEGSSDDPTSDGCMWVGCGNGSLMELRKRNQGAVGADGNSCNAGGEGWRWHTVRPCSSSK